MRSRFMTAAVAILALQIAQAAPSRATLCANLPDWSGFWELYDIGPSGLPTSQAVDKTISKLGSGVEEPSFTTAWKQKIKTDAKVQLQTDRVCAFGFPWLMESSPLNFEVVSDPHETAILFNDNEIRRIYTDGAGHTPDDILIPSPSGDSIGHWEGQTLVIETIGSQSRIWFTDAGQRKYMSLSDNAVYRERMTRTGPDSLEDTITAVDPEALTKPWTLTRVYHRVKNMNRVEIEQDCGAENDRNPVVNGEQSFIAPK